MNCPRCGRPVEPGAKFCSFCGFFLDQPTSQPEPQPAPQPTPQPAPQPEPQPQPQPTTQPVPQPIPQPVQQTALQPAGAKKKKGPRVLLVLLILAILAALGGGIFLGFTIFSKDDDDDRGRDERSSAGSTKDDGIDYEQLSFKTSLGVMDHYADIPLQFLDMDAEDAGYETALELADDIIPMFYQPELEYLLEYGHNKKIKDNLDDLRDYLADGMVEFREDVERYENYDPDERSPFNLWDFSYGSPRSYDIYDLTNKSGDNDFYDDYLEFLADEGVEEIVVYDVWYKDPVFNGNGTYCITDDIACYRIDGNWYLSAEPFLEDGGLLRF